MKKYILYLFSIVLLAACAKDYQEQNQVESMVFHAVIEDCSETKIHLNDELKSRWDKNDSVSIFVGTIANQRYKFEGETGDDSGSFSLDGSPSFASGKKLNANYAVYPYRSSTSISEEGVLSYTFPSAQNYAANSYGVGANTMVAVTENTSDLSLLFKNSCGYLRVSLYGDAKISSIVLKGNNGEKIAGLGTISASFEDAPSVTMSSSASSEITIDCGSGVSLGATAAEATDFYFVVPPVEFTQGFTITATDIRGGVFEKSTTKSVVITRNRIQKMAALECEIVGDVPNGELTFTAEEASTIALNKVGSPDDITLEYLVKNSKWTPYTIGETISLATGESVSFRAGVGGNATLSKDFGENYYQFTMTGSLEANGSIMSLLNSSLPDAYLPTSAFCNLFLNCTSLTNAPELPATTLADYCYDNCFKGCTSLSTAPSLPATTLAYSCYYGMFYGCIGLTSAPELPATTLAPWCYRCMFLGCTSLTNAPELPATTLANNCYRNMFVRCTGLTSAPDLPATTLADYCYTNCFNSCTGLTSTPALPATTLADHCYDYMFNGCTNLTSAPELPATTLADYCYDYMFNGCTGLTSVPSLPATTLASHCYRGMFNGCTSLTSAPELPATTLADYCYSYMFNDCSKLNYVKMLATDVSAINCMLSWLDGVSSTGTFVKNSAATWDISGPDGVPEGWTVELEYPSVDLGLSVKWATFNVGAAKPEEYGDYYAWGATEPWYEAGYAQEDPQTHWKTGKSGGYTWYNTPYQTANTTEEGETKFTKYLGSTTSSYKDESATDADALKTVLDPEDDAANVNWGGKWRMPTQAEWAELMNTSNCTWTWTTLNGVNGYKVQSKKSGFTANWIFLPAAGCRDNEDLYYVGELGDYWSSSLYADYPSAVHDVSFYSSDVTEDASYRCSGRSVRPVCD